MIDWTRVDDLKSEIGDDDFLEVVEMFLEETDQVAAHLDGPPDFGGVESLLHFLKGSALNLGLSDLAALCQAGEKRAASGTASEVELHLVTASYKASKALLLASLAQPRPG
jgi:histidine phosphotransfer protein HptB